MNATMYALRPTDLVMTDSFDLGTLWLRDLPKNPEALHAQALVASGDYFEMLAASLEQIAALLPLTSTEQYQLQEHIGQLIYLQHHYVITKK
ncbi:MAG TPA: hypothetical protein VLF59_05670 [Candidatus Saccharimonadales bacterium]|nr:hypothetical protein [Candidatus Saccharimonadales bacterium]